jgi:putative colanic acid biosynthesis UDP-glucose lipid carrier transferase
MTALHAPSSPSRPDHELSDQPVAISRRVAVDIVGFLDVLAVLCGGLLPAAIFAMIGELQLDWVRSLQGCLIAAFIAYLCLRHFGTYNPNEVHHFPVQPGYVALSLLIATACALGLALPTGFVGQLSAIWHVAWLTASACLVLANHVVARSILARLTAAGRFEQRIAIYGSGNIAQRLSGFLADPRLGIRLVGVYDDRVGERGKAETAGPAPEGSLIDLVALGRAGQIDRIIIAMPVAADRRTADIARQLEQLPVSLHICTHIESDLVDEHAAQAVSRLGPIGLLDVKSKPLSDWAPLVKSAEDLIVGTLALIVFAPVMALVALAVKIDDGGPILFRQRRHGLNKRVIHVLKFRTMRVMEDGAAVTQAISGDPRITRIGRFLRMTSLDELPQLFNVIRGEMSLVGPRPHALVHDDHFGEMLERYANRHQVKPGMTGWAQVCGLRGPTETPDKMRARVEHDLVYIQQWSLWFDLKILAMTVVLGFTNRNAL